MDRFQSFLLAVPILLFSVIAHEIAHGYAALKQGDNTALALGRLSWNPIRHVDLWMTFIIPAMLAFSGLPIVGGAKPVPVDPRNYRNYKRGDIIVSLAGVFTNLIVAVVCTVVFPLLGLLGHALPPLAESLGLLQVMMVIGIQLNLVLIAFNLIPVPPLDGSHVMKYLLPAALSVRYQRLGFAGIAVLILVMWAAPGALEWWLKPAVRVADSMTGVVWGQALPLATEWLR